MDILNAKMDFIIKKFANPRLSEVRITKNCKVDAINVKMQQSGETQLAAGQIFELIRKDLDLGWVYAKDEDMEYKVPLAYAEVQTTDFQELNQVLEKIQLPVPVANSTANNLYASIPSVMGASQYNSPSKFGQRYSLKKIGQNGAEDRIFFIVGNALKWQAPNSESVSTLVITNIKSRAFVGSQFIIKSFDGKMLKLEGPGCKDLNDELAKAGAANE